MKSTPICTIACLLVFSASLTPLLGQDKTAAQTPHMSSPTMMSSCGDHQAMAAALTSIDKLVADTKSSNDMAKLQSALDQIGSQVIKMRDEMNKCTGMMEMMEKMKSKPDAGAASHH